MTGREPAVIGLDIGTTSISVVVVEPASGRNLFVDSIVHRAALPPDVPGANIQNPALLLSIARQLLDEAVSRFRHAVAIGVTGQMHGIIPVNGHGDPTGPAYTWLDNRAASLRDEITEDLGRDVPAGYGATTLFALARTNSLRSDTHAVACIPGWVAGQLSNTSICPVSEGLAHSLGCFSFPDRGYDTAAWAGISSIAPPPVGVDATFIGESSAGIPICLPEGDNQAGFLATLRDPERSILVNVGTSGQVTFMCPDSGVTAPQSGLEKRPLPGNNVICTGAVLAGGKSFELITGLIEEIAGRTGAPTRNPFSILENLARPDDVPQVKSTFAGTRSDSSERGSISSIGLDNFSLAHLYWGIAGGVIGELARPVRPYLSMLDAPDSYVVAAGNALRRCSPMQVLLAERLCRPVRWLTQEEEGARGAALLAAAAAQGGIEKLREVQMRAIQYRSEPSRTRNG